MKIVASATFLLLMFSMAFCMEYPSIIIDTKPLDTIPANDYIKSSGERLQFCISVDTLRKHLRKDFNDIINGSVVYSFKVDKFSNIRDPQVIKESIAGFDSSSLSKVKENFVSSIKTANLKNPGSEVLTIIDSIRCNAVIIKAVDTTTVVESVVSTPVQYTTPFVEEIKDTSQKQIIIGEVPLQSVNSSAKYRQIRNMDEVFSTGQTLASVGLIVHLVGLGASTIMTFADGNSQNENSSIISWISGACMVAGPIVACGGATYVENQMKRSGFETEPLHVWREYGSGYAYLGGAVGAIFVGAMIASSSQSYEMLMPFLLGAAALAITGEVQWVRSVVHANIYVANNKRLVKSVSFVPYQPNEKSYGLSMNVVY